MRHPVRVRVRVRVRLTLTLALALALALALTLTRAVVFPSSLVHCADAPSKSFPGLRVSLAYKLLTRTSRAARAHDDA